MEEKQRCLRGRRFTKCWLFRKRKVVGNEESELELKTVKLQFDAWAGFQSCFCKSFERALANEPAEINEQRLTALRWLG